MNLFLTIVFSLFGFLSLCCIVGDRTRECRWQFTLCFAVCIAAALVSNIVGGAL